MCEQTEVQYLEGDVVWVKLGPCWWPGLVKDFDKLPSDVTQGLKKKPLAVVQFFDENSYEYIKNLNQIYKYNCRRKNEFIKKGLDLHRANNAYMDKFPTDVCTAEVLTGGDPDILTRDEFIPEQKPSYQAIFGTPSLKKTPKVGRGRSSIGSPRTPVAGSSQQVQLTRITHPRFIGQSDHVTRILQQSTPTGNTAHYTCYICGYESTRLNVIILHNKSHSSGTYSSPNKQKGKKNSRRSKRTTFSNTTTFDEDLQLIRDGEVIGNDFTSDSDEDEPEVEISKKRKISKKDTNATKKSKVSSICNNLLADWGDSDSEDEEQTEKTPEKPEEIKKKDTEMKSNDTNVIIPKKSSREDKSSEEKKSEDAVKPQEVQENTIVEEAVKESSCFDFMEEEEPSVLEKSPGRKIPRVIPQIPRKSLDVKETAQGEEPDESMDKHKEFEEAVKNILEEVTVPELPQLPGKQKNQLIIEEKSSTVLSKEDSEKTNGVLKPSTPPQPQQQQRETSERMTSPKKRFVRNFEDFENFCNEQKYIEDPPPKTENKTESTLEVSKLKSQLMSKLTDSPTRQIPATSSGRSRKQRKKSLEVREIEDSIQIEPKESEIPIEINVEMKIPIEKQNEPELHFEKEIQLSVRSSVEKIIGIPIAESIETPIVETMETPVVETLETSVETLETTAVETRQTAATETKQIEAVEMIETPVVETIEAETAETIETAAVEAIETAAVETLENTALEMIDTAAVQTTKTTEMSEIETALIESKVPLETEISEIVTPQVSELEPAVPVLEPEVSVPESEVLVSESEIPVPESEFPVSESEIPLLETEISEQKPEMEASELEDLIVESKIISPNTQVEREHMPAEKMEIEEDKIEEKSVMISTDTFHTKFSEELPISDATGDPKTKMLMNISDMCIDNSDTLSGLSTLAAVSELTGNFSYESSNTATDSPVIETEESLSKEPTVNIPESLTSKNKISEETTFSDPKPVVTLSNFSLDFSDSNSGSELKSYIPVERAKEVAENDNEQVSFITEDCVDDVKNKVQDSANPMDHEFLPEMSIIQESAEVTTHTEIPMNLHEEKIKLNEVTVTVTKSPSDAILDALSTNLDTSEVTLSIVRDKKKREDKIKERTERALETEMAKLTDTHTEVADTVHEQTNTSSSKLLEILTDAKSPAIDEIKEPMISEGTKTVMTSTTSKKVHMVITGDSKSITKKFDPKTSKFVIKSATSKSGPTSSTTTLTTHKSNKPIILSEKIIKPVVESENVSVKKVTSKRSYQDVEDIDTFIIQKSVKKSHLGDGDQQDIILTPKSEVMKPLKPSRTRGKPKIIEQTIIKAADVVPPVPGASTDSQQILDDSMFDINSMPIVLSDQILTPESIENMPVVMSDLMPTSSAITSTVQTILTEKPTQASTLKRANTIQQVKLLNKGKVTTSQAESTKTSQNALKAIVPKGLAKNQKVYQASSTKLMKSPAVITQPGKPGKFIILPSTTAPTTTGSKYTVGKRLQTVKTTSVITSPNVVRTKLSDAMMGSEGNKIMIVTNQQGVQSKVLITPKQQKLLNSKGVGTKIASKSPAQSIGNKSNVITSKSILTPKGAILSSMNSSGLVSQKSSLVMSSKGHQISTSTGQTVVTSEGQVLTPLTPQQFKTMRADAQKFGKKLPMQPQKFMVSDSTLANQKIKSQQEGKSKTVVIKGQTSISKRIQSPISDGKNIYIQYGQKGNQVVVTGQQIKGSGKQMLITSKGQFVKTDVGKAGITKQLGEKLVQRIQSSKSISAQPKLITKSSGKTQLLIAPGGKLASQSNVPPLSPISHAKKSESSHKVVPESKQLKLSAAEAKEKTVETTVAVSSPTVADQKPTTSQQVIINEGMANQIFTEGQIFAVPNETADGQPQSFVLVTVDEAGNLTPINNETLMTLDPNLSLTNESGNVVLHFDQGATEQTADSKVDTSEALVEEQSFTTGQTIVESQEQQLLSIDGQHLLMQDQTIMSPATSEQQILITESQPQDNIIGNIEETAVSTATDSVTIGQEGQTAVACSIGSGENSQQLIITGDPDMTQKFLVQLSEGNTDLNSLLSGAEGNIIINADGQQILLNTDPDNQILLMNNDGLIQTTTEGDLSQSAMYVTQQAMKNQDILAAALADTDVFQQDAAGEKLSTAQTKTVTSQLSPNSNPYSMNVSNVLETSLTLGSPIMTPLEVPSVPTKKINTDIESTLLSQVPSSLELPITITDPNISQTVAQQVMLGNELQSNLDLPIAISESAMTSIRSTEMSSPSFVYSLPSLDDPAEIETKTTVFSSSQSPVITSENMMYTSALTGSMSMPLLTEEPETPIEQQPTKVIEEEIVSQPAEEIVATTVTEVITETIVTEDNATLEYPKTTTVEDVMETQKISQDMPIPIEEELDLNASDICNSLSEPPPGMFDKSSFSLSLSPKYSTDKPEDTHEEIIEASKNEIHQEIPVHENDVSESKIINDEVVQPEDVQEKVEGSPLHEFKENDEVVTDTESVELNQYNDSVLSKTENSPLGMDESSCEIPIQPPIITKLDECGSPQLDTVVNLMDIPLPPPRDEPVTFQGNNINVGYQNESFKRERDLSEEGSSNKRTKLSCD